MKKLYLLILFWIFFPLNVYANETFLSLKKNKVNVRYGPGFEYPIKYIYKKINLPIKQIDKVMTDIKIRSDNIILLGK